VCIKIITKTKVRYRCQNPSKTGQKRATSRFAGAGKNKQSWPEYSPLLKSKQQHRTFVVGPKSQFTFWLLLSNILCFYSNFTPNAKEIKYPFIEQDQE